MADLTREERRTNRKKVLEALRAETGSSGGDVAAPRVRAFCADPIGADSAEFAYVGALTMQRFYIDPTKPNGVERQGLWQSVRTRITGSTTPTPKDIDAATTVGMLQLMAEERP